MLLVAAPHSHHSMSAAACTSASPARAVAPPSSPRSQRQSASWSGESARQRPSMPGAFDSSLLDALLADTDRAASSTGPDVAHATPKPRSRRSSSEDQQRVSPPLPTKSQLRGSPQRRPSTSQGLTSVKPRLDASSQPLGTPDAPPAYFDDADVLFAQQAFRLNCAYTNVSSRPRPIPQSRPIRQQTSPPRSPSSSNAPLPTLHESRVGSGSSASASLWRTKSLEPSASDGSPSPQRRSLNSSREASRVSHSPAAASPQRRAQAASPDQAQSSSSSTRRMLSSLGFGPGGRERREASSSSTASRELPSGYNARPGMEGGAEALRSASSRSSSSAQSAFGALMAGEREASMVTPRPPDASATPRPGAVQAAAAANAAAAEHDAPRDGSWAAWIRRTNRATASEADGIAIDPRGLAALSDESAPRSDDVEPQSPVGSTATRQSVGDASIESRYTADSLGRNSIASGLSAAEFGLPNVAAGTAEEREARRAERKKRKHAPPEILVIVRPPPSKQSNPLNLQIQLVTPSAAGGSGASRVSGEMSRDESGLSTAGSTSSFGSSAAVGGGAVTRSASIVSTRSQRSQRSEASSSGLSSTGGSAPRRVTPLYNLSFHTILPTVVTDAGTDQKVAKFSRKGVEIDGFGILEPRELLRGINDVASLAGATMSSSTGTGVTSSSRVAGSIVGSDVSPPPVGAGSDTGVAPSVLPSGEPPTSFEAMTPEARTDGGLSGKLMSKFKRLSLQGGRPLSASASRSSFGAATSQSGGVSGAFGRLGGAASSIVSSPSLKRASMDSSRPSPSGESIASTTAGSDVPQLVPGGGLTHDGLRHTDGYFWVIRKLTRRSDGEPPAEAALGADGQNAVLANVWRRFNVLNRAGIASVRHPPPSEITIRFEWTKDKSATAASSAAARRRSSAAASGKAGRGSAHPARAATEATPANGAAAAGPRVVTARRGSFDMDSAVGNGAGGGGTSPRIGGAALLGERLAAAAGANNGNSLKPPGSNAGSRPGSVHDRSPRRSVDSSALDDAASSVADDDVGDGEGSDPEDSETPWTCHLVLGPETRIPIASLAPAPHHPKLVGQLAIPFPLPDLSASGLGADGAGLTREELKDIVCVTCFFLTIRESWNGLGLKRRKGEPAWKLAAAQRAL